MVPKIVVHRAFLVKSFFASIMQKYFFFLKFILIVHCKNLEELFFFKINHFVGVVNLTLVFHKQCNFSKSVHMTIFWSMFLKSTLENACFCEIFSALGKQIYVQFVTDSKEIINWTAKISIYSAMHLYEI